jgi:hypothetical protein
MVTLRLFYAPVNLTILISFTYYIDYKHNLSKQLSTNLKLLDIYDQFKFVSDLSSNIRKRVKIGLYPYHTLMLCK